MHTYDTPLSCRGQVSLGRWLRKWQRLGTGMQDPLLAACAQGSRYSLSAQPHFLAGNVRSYPSHPPSTLGNFHTTLKNAEPFVTQNRNLCGEGFSVLDGQLVLPGHPGRTGVGESPWESICPHVCLHTCTHQTECEARKADLPRVKMVTQAF